MDLRKVTKLTLAGAALIAIGFAFGRYATPEKVVTKVEERVVEKVVEKVKEQTTKTEDKNLVTIIEETILPDGTIKRTTKIVDKSQLSSEEKRFESTETARASERTSETTITSKSKDWNVALMAGVNTDDDLFKKQIGYGLVVQRRILGPVYIGGYGNGFGSSSQSFGITLGGSF